MDINRLQKSSVQNTISGQKKTNKQKSDSGAFQEWEGRSVIIL